MAVFKLGYLQSSPDNDSHRSIITTAWARILIFLLRPAIAYTAANTIIQTNITLCRPLADLVGQRCGVSAFSIPPWIFQRWLHITSGYTNLTLCDINFLTNKKSLQLLRYFLCRTSQSCRRLNTEVRTLVVLGNAWEGNKREEASKGRANKNNGFRGIVDWCIASLALLVTIKKEDYTESIKTYTILIK